MWIKVYIKVSDEVDPSLTDPMELVEDWIERFSPLEIMWAEWTEEVLLDGG